jgi:uncharacterized membrane protein YccC
MQVSPVPWRVKLPIIAVAMAASVILAHVLSWPSVMVRAAGLTVVIGLFTWIGDKDASGSKRLLTAIGLAVGAGLASLLLDWLL